MSSAGMPFHSSGPRADCFLNLCLQVNEPSLFLHLMLQGFGKGVKNHVLSQKTPFFHRLQSPKNVKSKEETAAAAPISEP